MSALTQQETLPVRILTPEREVYAGTAAVLSVHTLAGEIEVLPGHEPLLAPLTVGLAALRDARGKTVRFAVHGGFLEVGTEGVTLLADTAERSDEIDLARAQEAERRAQERLASRRDRKEEFDLDRAKLALLRSITRIQAVEYKSVE